MERDEKKRTGKRGEEDKEKEKKKEEEKKSKKIKQTRGKPERKCYT